jgi:hypothetical protein
MEMTWLQQRGVRFRAAREVAEQLRSSLDCAEVRNALDAIPPVGGSSHQVDAVAARLGADLADRGLEVEVKRLQEVEAPGAMRQSSSAAPSTSGSRGARRARS